MVDERRSEEQDRKAPNWVRATFWGDHPDSLAPYVPSPLNIVREMLTLAKAGPGDVVYDLGCGDGRVLFTAMEEFKVAIAVGYDLDQEMVEALEKRIRDAGMVGRIMGRALHGLGIPVLEWNFYNHRATDGYQQVPGRGGAGGDEVRRPDLRRPGRWCTVRSARAAG